MLEQQFLDLKRTNGIQNVLPSSPLDSLREMIPIYDSRSSRRSSFDIDSDLINRETNGVAWDRFYEEGERIFKIFNLELSKVLRQCEEDVDGAANKRQKCDEIKRKYTKEYFTCKSL